MKLLNATSYILRYKYHYCGDEQYVSCSSPPIKPDDDGVYAVVSKQGDESNWMHIIVLHFRYIIRDINKAEAKVKRGTLSNK